MDLSTDFKEYHERVTSSLVGVTRTANQLASQDLSFHRSSSDKVARALDTQTSHLLRLTNKLLKAATQDSSVKTPRLRDSDDIEDNWRDVVDVVDDLLEKADASLDEYTGTIKRLSPSLLDRPQQSPATPTPTSHSSRTYFPKVLSKPQLLFDRKANNYDNTPFTPLLLTKPHAVKPLKDSIGDSSTGYLHPYAQEIEQYDYPPAVYKSAPPIPFRPAEGSSPIFVDTEAGVYTMLQELKLAGEIAVDLEHHDYHSYRGIVCLMQISTRDKDWIVDTLKPWREKLQMLNEVFADPAILKVFHGSSMDMIWLQRDLGLYVVGLFDTYYACEALNFPGRGLKYLLDRFANFEAQKQYQRSDWRIRPLPPGLLDYARSDTHYLLYIYDCVRNLLVENSLPHHSLVKQVLEGSKREALQVYERFVYNAESGRGSHGWFNLWTQRSGRYTPAQFAVFRALHAWRDEKARELDESPVWVLDNRSLWTVSESMPTNQTELYRVCRPVPENFGAHARELFGIIAKAKHESKDGPPPEEVIQQNIDKYGITHNRWLKNNSNSQRPTQTGVGATLQQLKLNGDIATNPDANLTGAGLTTPTVNRSNHSSLWGGIGVANSPVVGNPELVCIALKNVLHFPAASGVSFSAPARVVSEAVNSVPITSAASTPAAQSNITPEANGVSALYDCGYNLLKRKAEGSPEVISGPSSDMDIDPPPAASRSIPASPTVGAKPSDSEIEDRRAAKALRKIQKGAEKQARKAAEDERAKNTVPFDYANAKSLLDPAPQQSPVRTNGGAAREPMNPFAKALDTGTGARRNKITREHGGKSMTFKS